MNMNIVRRAGSCSSPATRAALTSSARAAVRVRCTARCSRYSASRSARRHVRVAFSTRTCTCSADPRNYALSIRDEDEARGGIPVVKHYKIRTLGEARGFYINAKNTFPSFGALISYYESTSPLCYSYAFSVVTSRIGYFASWLHYQ